MAIGLRMGPKAVNALGHEAIASPGKSKEQVVGARSFGKQAARGLGGDAAFATVTYGLHGVCGGRLADSDARDECPRPRGGQKARAGGDGNAAAVE
jgi:hypothetical protein